MDQANKSRKPSFLHSGVFPSGAIYVHAARCSSRVVASCCVVGDHVVAAIVCGIARLLGTDTAINNIVFRTINIKVRFGVTATKPCTHDRRRNGTISQRCQQSTRDPFLQHVHHFTGRRGLEMPLMLTPKCITSTVVPSRRYRHLVETLGDLSLEPLDSGALLANSRAQQDIDSMLALLKAEERQNSRAEHSRSAGGLGNDGGRGGGGSGGPGGGSDLLATPCLEFLLEERLIKVLCELGANDLPAGTMALVLGACASLLGQVRPWWTVGRGGVLFVETGRGPILAWF